MNIDNLTIKKKPFLTSRYERNYVVYIWLVDFMHSAKQCFIQKCLRTVTHCWKIEGLTCIFLKLWHDISVLTLASNLIVIYILRKHPYVYVMYLAPNLFRVFLQAEGGNGWRCFDSSEFIIFCTLFVSKYPSPDAFLSFLLEDYTWFQSDLDNTPPLHVDLCQALVFDIVAMVMQFQHSSFPRH